ncbi:AI-2 transport protein TqsA [Marinomonas gallaica]|uniref:AI-2 transport protein TqsA n=1 Tax=Marinomonas gallaica TaxID=1806667 RepID=A0A1C3JUW2_9GAMM|nr:AI-2E family transporter [Marinomonas gallaica]SBT18922.1 AI-2 transport protein TqsA [Marinomonas gallaica]SBT21877.1 AI-2 transport protein TqsA [Marinomonas gallaica]
MSDSRGTTQWLLAIAAFILIIAGLKEASQIVVPFMLSVFIAIICSPLQNALRRYNVPIWISIIIIVLIILACLGSIGLLVAASLDNFSQQLPTYRERFGQEMSTVFAQLNGFGFNVSYQQIKSYIDPSSLMNLFTNTLTSLGSVLTNVFLVVMIVVFILLEAAEIPKKLSYALDDADSSMEKIERFITTVNRYLMIKTLISIATGLFVGIWVSVIGVDFPILWGVCAFLLNFIPNIGSIIAAVPAMFLAFVQLGTFDALLTGLGFLLVNLVMGNFIEPRFMGKGVGLSPLVVFLSLMLWGWVFGPVGMLLSIPLTIILKFAFETNPKMRWLAILLDSKAHP